MFRLDERVALVTGAARGLGRALAQGLAAAGATVVLGDRDLPGAERVAAELSGVGHRALATALDIADYASCEAFVARADKTYGRVDILVNNAAIDIIEPALATSSENWSRIVHVNLTGQFHCAQVAAKQMIAGGRGGSIISISSLAATAGIANLAAYSAAKAGVNQMTRVMAVELAQRGVRVNAIAPGYLENIMLGAEATHADPKKEASIRQRTPMGRRARLEELVGPVVFLASDAASYVTGAVLAVDGGYTAA